jgi:hypothetical protein
MRAKMFAKFFGQQWSDGGFADAMASGEFNDNFVIWHFLFERRGNCFQPARA